MTDLNTYKIPAHPAKSDRRIDLTHCYPDALPPKSYRNGKDAVERLKEIYNQSTQFLLDAFAEASKGHPAEFRYRAYYPEIRLASDSHSHVDSRLAFGYVGGPGHYQTTITRPKLFSNYLESQIDLLMHSHDTPVTVGTSNTPIPLHFAFPEGTHISGSMEDGLSRPLRDLFDAPDLSSTDDRIVNGSLDLDGDSEKPLAPFTAQRIDYSLQRLSHYTAASPEHFQNFVLFTNY